MKSDKLNQECKAWSDKTLDELKAQFDRLNIIHRAKSPSPIAAVDLLKASLRKKYGTVSSIAFKFPRHMIFVHKGVGRGYPISAPRKAKPWFSEVVDKRIEDLADIVAENTADMFISDSFRIK